jgi:hypothetical protein
LSDNSVFMDGRDNGVQTGEIADTCSET